MGITDLLRKAVSRLFPTKKLESRLNIKIYTSARMERAIQLWNAMYENRAYWLGGENNIKSKNLAAAISSEFARLILTEFSIDISGNERADFIGKQISEYMISNLKQRIEYWAALGGMVMKPYVSGINPETGKPTSIRIDYVDANRFFPTAWDSNGMITGAIFLDMKTVDDRIYTRVEYHDLKGTVYTVKNFCFESTKIVTESDGTTSVTNQFAKEVPLSKIPDWDGIEEVVEMDGIRRPFFVYAKVPQANNIDKDSPLGVSCYSRAVDQIREADRQYSRTIWEYEAKEAAIDADADLFRLDRDGNPVLPEGRDRLYRTYNLNTDHAGNKQIEVYSPEIRDASLLKGQNAILRDIEFLVGLAYGTLSDPNDVDKTAEEIKTSKQRSYVTVSDMQTEWDKTFDALIDVMDMLCDLYDIVPAGEVEKTCTWGDGVLEDTDKEYQRRWAMVVAGKMRPEKFISWYFGCSEEDALEMMPPQNPQEVVLESQEE